MPPETPRENRRHWGRGLPPFVVRLPDGSWKMFFKVSAAHR
jgi:hypothetical protein